MARQINDAGLKLIESFEGLRLDAYTDVAGIWTIGYGHIRGVGPGMTITQDQATAFLRQDLGQAEASVDAATSSVETDDNQFAATGCRLVAPNTRSSVSRQCPKTGANRLDKTTQIGQTAHR